MKLFVGSQFLTEILLRHPDYLERLTNHKQLADFKSRKHFLDEAHMAAVRRRTIADKFDALQAFSTLGAAAARGLRFVPAVRS